MTEPPAGDARTAPDRILVLCWANLCRSPMAAAFLARWLAGQPARVLSAGAVAVDGMEVPAEVASAMDGYGIDIRGHRARRAQAADLAGAGLVLVADRTCLRHAVAAEPRCWPRVFTIKEIVRLGARTGPREPAEPLGAWLDRAGSERTRRSLLGASADDDVADPAGGPTDGYLATAAELAVLTGEIAGLGWGVTV